MEDFRTISPGEIEDNAFKTIGSDWMLVTAGSRESFNTMTAAWGGMGFLWNKNVCFIFIRPQRYTYGFIEKSETFTLSFFDEEYRKILQFCGTKSGRDVDKVAETGITPLESERGSIYFSESRLIIECRKIYFQDIDPANFLEPAIADNYPGDDYHRMYVGEVLSCLRKQI